jgi:hypothetical protein
MKIVKISKKRSLKIQYDIFDYILLCLYNAQLNNDVVLFQSYKCDARLANIHVFWALMIVLIPRAGERW